MYLSQINLNYLQLGSIYIIVDILNPPTLLDKALQGHLLAPGENTAQETYYNASLH